MKKFYLIFYVFVFLSFNNDLKAGDNPVERVSNFKLAILGGMNTNQFNNFGPSLILEGNLNISNKLYFTLSAGYSRLYQNINDSVKYFFEIKNEKNNFYQTVSYELSKKGYEIFPLNVGFKYYFNRSNLSIYSFANAGYNFISTKFYQSQKLFIGYESEDEIPNEFFHNNSVTKPNFTYSLEFGFGIAKKISKNLIIDLRYSFTHNFSLINSNRVLIGLYF